MLKISRLVTLMIFALTGSVFANHMDDHTIDKRTAPLSKVKVAKAVEANAAPAAPRSGETIVNTYCMACHGTGMAGAHKLGNAEAWGPIMATGMDAVLASAKKGKNVMPPMGTCADCSDDELKAAIEHMVNFKQ